jgi:hypothetical protein|tara:strand:- start:308 stop:484 length:177 start_codon:yes stop_codon:yes gene_type:complete
MNKIIEFFKTLWVLSLVTIKSLWVLLKEDMKKEAQTYKEEREDQKKVKNNRPFKQDEW